MNQHLSKRSPPPALIKQYRSGIIYLMPAFTGTEQTDRLWSGGDRRKDTEATHQPHVLHSTVLLVGTKKEWMKCVIAGIDNNTRTSSLTKLTW